MATGPAKPPAARRTATTRKTPAKTAAKAPAKTAAKTEAKPAASEKPAPAAPQPVVVKPADPAPAAPELKKKELIDLVVAQSGVKKKDAKPAVEAVLAILGETLGAGREFNLQPFGKLRINRAEERSNGRIIVCKLRQAKRPGEKTQEDEISAADPLAEAKG